MAKAVYGGLIQTILEVVGPRNPELVGAVSLWRSYSMEGHAGCAAVHRNPFLVHADGRSDNE